MAQPEAKLKLKESVFIRQRPDGRANCLDVNQEELSMLEIEGVGVDIVVSLKKGCTYQELLNTIVKDYDVTPEEAQKDLDEFLGELNQQQMIEEVG